MDGFYREAVVTGNNAIVGLNGQLVGTEKDPGLIPQRNEQLKKAEAKLIRCIKGSVYDVIVDLRQESMTFLKWIAIELNDKNKKMLYVPEGFAHGFQTLEDDVEMFYQMSEFYDRRSALGVRWNDPDLNIEWPIPNPCISENDASYPDINYQNLL